MFPWTKEPTKFAYSHASSPSMGPTATFKKSLKSQHHHPPAMGTWGGSSAGGSRSRGSHIYKLKYCTVYKFCIRSAIMTLLATLLCLPGPYPPVVDGGNPDAKRLYDDLLSNYNKLVRPVVNVSEAVTVRLKLKLSQLIDVVSHLYNKRCSYLISL